MTEPEHASLPWRKSSISGETGSCVEVAIGRDHVHVRHSQHHDGPVLTFLYREWDAFLAGVLKGEFRLPDPATPADAREA